MRCIRTTTLASFALLAAPAFADISAYNKAIAAGDIKTAAAEAKATWPTLDKTRPDLAVIGREFAFTLLASGDAASAQALATEAVDAPGESVEAKDGRHGALIVGLTADLIVTPNRANRNTLFDLMAAEPAGAKPTLIAMRAIAELSAYDAKVGNWSGAQATSEIGKRLAEAGGPPSLPKVREYELDSAVAGFLARPDRVETLQKFGELQTKIVRDVDAAPSDAAAAPLVPIFWMTMAWKTSAYSSFGKEEPKKHEDLGLKTDRPKRLGVDSDDDDKCSRVFDMKTKPEYPISAARRPSNGSVIMQADFDSAGYPSNPRVLAAAPDKPFGDAVLKAFDGFKIKPGKDWGPGCNLKKEGYIINFRFVLP